MGLQHPCGGAEEEQHQKEDRPGLQPAIESVAEQRPADHAGDQLDPDLQRPPPIRGWRANLCVTLVPSQTGVDPQLADAVVERP